MVNELQQKAIMHDYGAAMVLAGPGTGKTTVITHRIRRLIGERIASAGNILVVTFSRNAAVEMQERFERIYQKNHTVTFGTFHSVFLNILRENHAISDNNAIASELERERIIKEIIRRRNIDIADEWQFIRSVLGEISRVKAGEIKPLEFQSQVCAEEIFREIYKDYQTELVGMRMIDFDDMILQCHDLLCCDAHALRKCQEKYQFILIDEFQDINKMQYDTVKLIAGEAENIFVVGDDDQSIYGFRGAAPKYMFAFQKDFHNVNIINLGTNYRSTDAIIDMASRVIRNNTKRYKKKYISARGKGTDVDIRKFVNSEMQYSYMLQLIQQYVSEGIAPEEIAVLVRNNSSIQMIKNYLSNGNIKTSTKNVDSIYKHPIARDVISLIRLSKIFDMNTENPELIQVINKPERYVARAILMETNGNISQILKRYSGSKEITKNVKEFVAHLDMLNRFTPYAAINYIIYGMGYERYLDTYAARKQVKPDMLLKIVEKMKRESVAFKNTQQWLNYVENYGKQKSDTNGTGVNIITMHRAKGLEYKVVFLPDVNQGVIPDSVSIRNAEIEEERRLFYVAMTRASDRLHIFYAERNMGRVLNESQFIKEMIDYLHF